MNYKIEAALKKSKKTLIIAGILWIFFSIVFVMPIAISIVEASTNNVFNVGIFIQSLFTKITDIGNNLGKVFTEAYISTFFTTLGNFTIIYLICATIGVIKAKPKNEYTDIEHGSSDWAENGSQYKVLSKNKGIILAENNYLPVDKRGNVNVLVVGRIWFW